MIKKDESRTLKTLGNTTLHEGQVNELGLSLGIPGADGGITIGNAKVYKTSIIRDVRDTISIFTTRSDDNDDEQQYISSIVQQGEYLNIC